MTDYAKNTVEVYNKEEVEEVEERHPKNTDIDDYDQRNSLLDTINLSYAGNVDLAQAVGKVKYFAQIFSYNCSSLLRFLISENDTN